MSENTLGSKRLYKIFLSVVKFIPNLLALFKVIGLTLSYFGMNSFFLTCIGGTSIVTLLILYLISFIFKFCGLYRLSLNYVTLVYLMTIFDWYFPIPLDVKYIYYIYTAITGVFVTAWVYIFYKNRNNPKVDHIKQLCDKYVCR